MTYQLVNHPLTSGKNRLEHMTIADTELPDHIRRVRLRLASLKTHLDDLGYIFDRPDEVLPGPHPETERILNRINEIVGPVPACIASFWREIGSIDFCGHHPDWLGCEYPDPIVVFRPTTAESELEDYLYHKDDYLDAFGTFRIPIAPDYNQKKNVSGGMWYGIAVPDDRVDVPLLEERHDTTFLNYLDIAIEWGGFPGVKHTESEHNWPIDELKRVANAI